MLKQTINLKNFLRKRILEKNFDDVIKKGTFKEKVTKKVKEINKQKNKYGLVELYEKNIINKTCQDHLENFDQKKNLSEYEDILRLKVELFHQLDSLTNFYFRLKPSLRKDDKDTATSFTQSEETFPCVKRNEHFENMFPETLMKKKKNMFFGKNQNSKNEYKQNLKLNKSYKNTQDKNLLIKQNKNIKKIAEAQNIFKKLLTKDYKTDFCSKENHFVSKTMFTFLKKNNEFTNLKLKKKKYTL